MRKLLKELNLSTSPALNPVLDLASKVQRYRKERMGRGGKVTRSTVLYALATLDPKIRAAVFPSPEAWSRFVEQELELKAFESGSAS